MNRDTRSVRLRRALCASAMLGIAAGGGASVANGAALVIDGGSPGRLFEGIGALSAGASSRLLPLYREPQRSEVLDYLFKPKFGASLQTLKVEIGGDVNSTDGTEPSFEHERGRLDFSQGYEFWLMKQAKQRNPRIVLQSLQWGAPGWIGGGKFFSDDNIDYIIDFIEGTWRHWGLRIDFQGIWNETGYDIAWIKKLRRALDQHGLWHVQIVAADAAGDIWHIADDMRRDPELAAAIGRVGVHYPGGIPTSDIPPVSTEAAKELGTPLWASEDGPWRGDWTGAVSLARRYNQNYVVGRMTSTLVWSPVSADYDLLVLPDAGLMRANEPWSGHYDVEPAIWATAHTTQFAQPGWRYLDSASRLIEGGSVVSLEAPNQSDYSVIIETGAATAAQTLSFKVAGGLDIAPLHVWRSDKDAQFVRMADVVPSIDGRFALEVAPQSIVSLTTTTGQHHGHAPTPPPSAALALPYQDDFTNYHRGQLARNFIDQSGVFEVDDDDDGDDKMLRQIVRRRGIEWYAPNPTPYSIVGSKSWTDYRVAIRGRADTSPFITVYGRIASVVESQPPSGYGLTLNKSGAWMLTVGHDDASINTLASGVIETDAHRWHRLQLTFRGDRIRAEIDHRTVADLRDTSYANGLVGIGSDFGTASFKDLDVDPIAP